jgi:hypothetical protein
MVEVIPGFRPCFIPDHFNQVFLPEGQGDAYSFSKGIFS